LLAQPEVVLGGGLEVVGDDVVGDEVVGDDVPLMALLSYSLG
jgi:hypothetical protein